MKNFPNSMYVSTAYWTLWAGAALGCATTSVGPEAELPSAVAPSEQTIAAYRSPSGNPLQALIAAEAERREEGFSAQANWVSGLWHAQLGEYSLAASVYTPLSGSSYGLEPEEGECTGLTLPDSVQAFCKRITEVGEDVEMRDPDALPPQFVFVEDQPNLPAMRVFGQQILQCAQGAGFTHLAVEGLQEDGATVTARGYVTVDSGLVTREPQLAGLIEKAVGMGYQIINYDEPDRLLGNSYFSDVEVFAEAQAANLLEKTYAQNSDIKVLVWTMPYQSRKQEWRQDVTRRNSVASRVFEQTGLEPYCLEQETMTPGFAINGETTSGSYLVSGEEQSDCAWSFYPLRALEISPAPLSGIVMHTPPESGDQRWAWLNAVEDERMSVTASCDGCQRLLIQAFPAGSDPSTRVPTDQTICNSASQCQMAMAAGEYDLVVWGESGEPMGTETVTLAAGGAVTVDL